MRTKELTATAVGVSRLGLPADIVTALVEAFESRVSPGRCGWVLMEVGHVFTCLGPV